MAVIKRPVPAVVKQVAKQVAKPVTKQVAKPEGFQVVSIDSIEFLPSGRGGGKPMDPAVAKLVDKALELEIGQGFKIPAAMRLERVITGQNGASSTLYTYKGAQSLSKKAKQNEMRFRTRRDTTGNLWLFRVEPIQYAEVAEVAEE